MMHRLAIVVAALAMFGSATCSRLCFRDWAKKYEVCNDPCTSWVRTVLLGGIIPYKEYACSIKDPGGGGDPHFGGFNGQFLTFDGKDDRWYSVLQEERIAVHMRTAGVSCGSSNSRYISSLGITVPNLKESSSATTIGIFNNLDDNCHGKSLLDGEIQVELKGEALSPGVHFDVATQLKLVFEHTVPACQYQYRPKAIQSFMHAGELEHGARRLRSGFGSSDPEIFAAGSESPSMEGPIANPEACKRWNAQVSDSADSIPPLYTASGREASTIIVSLPDMELRIEHKTTICGDVRLDFHLLKYDAPADASGILGQTVNMQYDASGTPIYKGDGVLPGHEEDYEVSGPFSEYL